MVNAPENSNKMKMDFKDLTALAAWNLISGLKKMVPLYWWEQNMNRIFKRKFGGKKVNIDNNFEEFYCREYREMEKYVEKDKGSWEDFPKVRNSTINW